MIKKFIINSAMKTIRNYYPDYDNEQLEKIQYGLEAIYLSTTKFVVILVISFVFGFFKEALLVFLFFNILRTTGFGLHASKSWICWITSLPTFIGIPLICKYELIPNYALIIVALLSLICFMFFAPADTHKRPLIRKNKRIIYKVITILIGLIYTLLTIFTNSIFWKSVFALTMLIEAILVCPLTYILFKLPYNNYKSCKN